MTRRTTGKNRRNNPRAALLDVAAALGRIVSRLCSPPPPPPPPPPLPFFLSFVYLLRRETRRHRQPSELADDLLDGRGIGGADALGKVDDTLPRIASFLGCAAKRERRCRVVSKTMMLAAGGGQPVDAARVEGPDRRPPVGPSSRSVAALHPASQTGLSQRRRRRSSLFSSSGRELYPCASDRASPCLAGKLLAAPLSRSSLAGFLSLASLSSLESRRDLRPRSTSAQAVQQSSCDARELAPTRSAILFSSPPALAAPPPSLLFSSAPPPPSAILSSSAYSFTRSSLLTSLSSHTRSRAHITHTHTHTHTRALFSSLAPFL